MRPIGLRDGYYTVAAARLRKLTRRQLIVAGGIRSREEVDALDALGDKWHVTGDKKRPTHDATPCHSSPVTATKRSIKCLM